MRNLVRSFVVATGVTIILPLALAALAIENTYIEEFTTTRYKDALNTTALWDTVAGELKLYPFVLSLVGTYNTPGEASAVAVSGDHAFVADGVHGLQVIDISDPGSPTLVGTCNTPGEASAVAVSGDRAFVADYNSGLQVIDISNPASPTLLGAYDTPGGARGVAVSGNHAYVADAVSGLQVIDISNPASPTLVGTCDTPGLARGVTVSGDRAYVADYSSGLQVIDISNPASPTLVGTCDTPGYAWDVSVSGDHAYVADYSSGLQVIDISDPTSPTLVGTYNTPDYARGVAVSGNRAYVADYGSGLQVIDISDPTNPTLAGTYNTPGNAHGVTVSGDHAFVADVDSGLQVIDVGDPVTPTLVGTCDTPSHALGVVVSGDHAYVADYSSGLQVIDISDPTSPTLLGTYNTPGIAWGVAVSGDHAYVADEDHGLQVIDIGDPSSPMLVGTCDTPDYAFGVAISGAYALVANADSGLQVIDISDPANPTLLGTCDTPGYAIGVAVSGDHAYVADWTSGLQVIDINDPANPALLGTCNTPGIAWGVAVSGNHAYVADDISGLQVIDISNPANPTLLGSCDMPGSAWSVAISGDYAFVAEYAAGLHSALQVVDISDPASPTLVGACNTPGWARGVAVSGDHAFVADQPSGLQVIQVFQSEFDNEDSVGWSLAVDASNDTIFAVCLTTAQMDSVTWELSADGGVSWQGIEPDGIWNQLPVPGIDLVWRSKHAWAAPGINPGVTGLEIGWLGEAASIDSIVDVPDDQGGWVRAHFARSGRDFSDEVSLPIDHYGIWQRVDNAALIAMLNTLSASKPERCAASDAALPDGLPVIRHQGRTYLQSRTGLVAGAFPSGTWEWVATVPAIQQDAYIARVPTAADSSGAGTNHAVFVATAHTTTPSIWYVSEPDSGYSVDNIVPAVPGGFAVAYNTGSGNLLTWEPSADEDFQYFNIYRSSDPDFVPSSAELVHSATGTSWSDPEYDGWSVYYKITALDYVGNESAPASPGTVTAVAESVIPRTYGLYPNVPNPFNPNTTIRYDVPAGGGVVALRIYDVTGRLVRTLVDGQQTFGQKTISWNGRDDHGRGVVSGVYFYRLQAPGYKKTLKMILVR